MSQNLQYRTILLPKEVESSTYTLVSLPDYRDISKSSKYLVSCGSLFELKSVSSDPKSIIFENETDQDGIVVESPEIIMATKFNVVYLLISTLYNQSSSSYISLENFIDNHEWIGNVPEALVEDALEKICDKITENGEFFYKVNQEKTKEFIKSKIESVKQQLSSSKLMTQIKMSLYVDTETEIPMGMEDQEILYLANEMISSHLSISLELHDFEDLLKYKKGIQARLTAKSMVMEAQKPTKHQPKTGKAAKGKVKKPVVKVAKGKGALDMLFKKR
ncbi:hypothetical protein PSN45_002847 [Yamadazyma tenuis]|uniref:uncharacterized protein n=1 Tax=Candida tenuis TaxID=2315449 RepID=UPI0027A8A91E|nr:hypothetical protein PSN45_002847 [Yamadazyma tenuis]